MAGLRIPGSLGLGPDFGIDAGTLARALSLPPGPLNDVEAWARRQLRRGAREGIVLTIRVTEELVMREVRELKDDVEGQLRFLAGLPAELQKKAAYELFASGFSHYLPKKLLRHYVWGGGAALNLTLQEMIDCNPYIDLKRSKAFRDLLDAAAKDPGKKFPLETGVPSAALTNGTLGQFTVKVKGELVADAKGGWQVTGTMTFFDTWDFDPKDFATGGRSMQGELKTRVANEFLPGKGFDVHGVNTKFTQSQADAAVVWAGGTPSAKLDRVAELDVEVQKPDR